MRKREGEREEKPRKCVSLSGEQTSSLHSIHSMAAIGLSPSSSLKLCDQFPRNADSARAPAKLLRLSSASSDVFGDRVINASNSSSCVPQRALLRRRRSPKPLVVSPKAVSDSQNSQTCLDPDASRV